MRKKYFIQEHLHKKNLQHGSIGNVDAEKLLVQKGYEPLVFPCMYDFSIKAKLKRFAYLLKTFLAIPSGAIVVIQFPLDATLHRILVNLLQWKKVHIICFITDLEGMPQGNAQLLQTELRLLRRYSFFLVHNAAMAEWLQKTVPNCTYAEIEFFDFLATPVSLHQQKNYQVLFAGNLQKSAFVDKLGKLQASCPAVQFMLYGPDYAPSSGKPLNVVYKGGYEAYALVHHLQGSFGLVWDGNSIDGCTGSYGEYLALNSPHKLSLYMLAGLPLIVPAMSAGAQLVKKYRIGYTIERLHDLQTLIDSIDEATYQQMIENMRPLAARIAAGKCLGDALAVMEDAISKKNA